MLQQPHKSSTGALPGHNASGYSTREVAELIGLNPDQIRHYVRRKLVTPDRGPRSEYRFSFQDVVLLRTAKRLLVARVKPRKANRLLLKLGRNLGQERSLTGVRIVADGDAVVVREDNRLWNAESGQGHLDFTTAERAETESATIAKLSPPDIIVSEENNDLSSDEWYNLGLDLEEIQPERAPDAYRRAVHMDPKNADALVNLGRLFQIKGDLKSAKRYYELALEALPKHELAAYNMGTVFDELNELQLAAHYYERAPTVPDAHYNLARISELAGDEVSALRHMRHYRQMLDDA